MVDEAQLMGGLDAMFIGLHTRFSISGFKVR